MTAEQKPEPSLVELVGRVFVEALERREGRTTSTALRDELLEVLTEPNPEADA